MSARVVVRVVVVLAAVACVGCGEPGRGTAGSSDPVAKDDATGAPDPAADDCVECYVWRGASDGDGEEAKRQGFNITGPLPPDSVFFRALQGQFDAAIAMYHDQGHIAIKMLGITEGVNVTLGLPIIRTSVDHGTVFGKAGKGTADPTSLIQSIELASVMCRNRRRLSPQS